MAQAAAKNDDDLDAGNDGREPFAAYLSDDVSQSAAQKIAVQRDWSTSNIRKGGLATALRLLGVAPPPLIMIVDVDGMEIDEIESGLTELTRLGSSVLVLGTVNDVNYCRRIIRTGARDYLIKPVDAETLGEVFVRLEQPEEEGKPGGRVVGLIGARGGVGVTTLAINTAWVMAERLSRRVALVDLDMYAGNIALALDIEPTRGLREAIDDPDRVDDVFLKNAMAKFGKSLSILATEEAFDDTMAMTDDKYLTLADNMRNNFDMTILDIPRHFIMREPALFSRCDEIVIVTELNLQSLRDSNRLSRLMRVRNSKAKIHVIANKTPAKPDVSAKEFEEGMESALRCNFALDSKALAKASLQGEPLVSADPKHKMSGDLHKLCIEMAGVPEEAKKGFFKRHLSRK
jgi:pilus assembly protein CpaE